MRWECGECGECTDGLRPPTPCPSCRHPDGIFVLTEAESEAGSSGDPRPAWTRIQLDEPPIDIGAMDPVGARRTAS